MAQCRIREKGALCGTSWRFCESMQHELCKKCGLTSVWCMVGAVPTSERSWRTLNNGFICNAVPEDSTCTAQQHHSCFRHRLTDWLAEWLLQQVGSRRAVGSTPDEKREITVARALLKEKPMAVERPNLLSCISSVCSHTPCSSAPASPNKNQNCDFSITKAPSRNCFGY